ncbi:hypothetical protein [Kamptonema formosum]|uniref:hypothetical protein n=1 Tax=Kamptonema formosum TaxID=331992 RepID=UPI00034665FB|nr:hypothetical protein [Oscillatoria sp. PCC 10802]
MTGIKLNEFTAAMSESPMAERLQNLWGHAERWDVASTGCVANITPIFGYLWLMVAATPPNRQNSETSMYVTKLPSKGGSCGTVDILESGGLSFPSDAQAIAQQCKKELGVICQPTDDLAPVDKELMRVRGLTNLMTNFPLVYASILSKRIAIGCTHCIVDVKLGQATKMLSPRMDEKQIQLVTNDYFNEQGEQRLVIDQREILKEFKSLLSEVVGGTNKEFPDLKEQPWIVQLCQDSKQPGGESKLNQLKEIRWLLTNSSMPQCRAIGRQLILIHIDELISGKRGKGEHLEDLLDENLLNQPTEYKKLYCDILPKICGINEVELAVWEELKEQWRKLKKCLPKLESNCRHRDSLLASSEEAEANVKNDDKEFTVQKYLYEPTYDSLEKSYPEGQEEDLKIVTFGLYPYQLAAKDKVKIKCMDAYALDKLFGWLCGENPYDPEVGIWLHKLPGEEVEKTTNNQPDERQKKHYKKLAACGLWQQPIISIFYRPSRCSESEVFAKAREFLCRVKV